MDYRPLGRTGVKVSPLCLGCMNFGGKTDETESARIIHAAIDAGVNFLDTANAYNGGRSEAYVGKALAEAGKRHRIVLATKFHFPMDPDDPNARGNSRRHIISQCDASLRRLKTDWIDLYQLHRPSSQVPIDETLRGLDDLIRWGKIRYAGCSTFASWQLVESLWVAEKHRLNRFVCEQPPYNLLDRSIERELLPACRTYGLGVIPWSPLAGGFFTHRYKPGQQAEKGSRLAGWWHGEHLTPEAFGVLEQVTRIAEARGVTPSQVAIAWVMQQPGVSSPIIGPRTIEQLSDNLGAIGLTLEPSELEALDAAGSPKRSISKSLKYYDMWDHGPHTFRV